MKVVVYAITKNEEKFVRRWYESMKEADEIYVLDTGSDDNTVKLLKDLGVNVVVSEIIPWRFDVARNKSLDLVPIDTDICVCTDLDEVFVPGWRDVLEKVWKEGTNRLRYVYNWSLDDDDKPVISFYSEKIHSRNNYKWVHPVHEILTYSVSKERIEITDDIIINHYPDSSKSRGGYLSLLELSVEEEPMDDRNIHYLGREYMYYSRWNDCIDTLIRHLNLSTATWKDERCASMRFIARSYMNLGRYDEAKLWLEKAVDEAPYLREPYVEMALLQYRIGNDVEVISYYNLGLYDLSLYYVNRALEYNCNDDRLINNKKIIEEKNNKE